MRHAPDEGFAVVQGYDRHVTEADGGDAQRHYRLWHRLELAGAGEKAALALLGLRLCSFLADQSSLRSRQHGDGDDACDRQTHDGQSDAEQGERPVDHPCCALTPQRRLRSTERPSRRPVLRSAAPARRIRGEPPVLARVPLLGIVSRMTLSWLYW
jgi:hypothetical protein